MRSSHAGRKSEQDGPRSALLAGALGEAELTHLGRPPGIALYLCSTWGDTTAERDYWQHFLFPSLGALCTTLGLGFEVVDLRWGVPDAAAHDRGRTELCLSELARCCDVSAPGAVAVVHLSGERYGWRQLPSRVPLAELEAIMKHMPPDSIERAVLDASYRADANALPSPVAKLRSPKEVSVDASPEVVAYLAAPEAAQEALSVAVTTAAEAAGLPSDAVDEWRLSVTHKELRAAGNKGTNPRAPGNVVIVRRTLAGLKGAVDKLTEESAALAAPPDDGRRPGAPRHAAALYSTPAFDLERLTEMREEAARLGGASGSGRRGVNDALRGRLVTADHVFSGRSINAAAFPEDAAYVRRMSAELYAVLAASAEAAASAREALDDVEREAAAHGLVAFKKVRTSSAVA